MKDGPPPSFSTWGSGARGVGRGGRGCGGLRAGGGRVAGGRSSGRPGGGPGVVWSGGGGGGGVAPRERRRLRARRAPFLPGGRGGGRVDKEPCVERGGGPNPGAEQLVRRARRAKAGQSRRIVLLTPLCFPGMLLSPAGACPPSCRAGPPRPRRTLLGASGPPVLAPHRSGPGRRRARRRPARLATRPVQMHQDAPCLRPTAARDTVRGAHSKTRGRKPASRRSNAPKPRAVMNDECCGPWWKMVNHLQLKRLAPDHYGLRVVMRYMAAMAHQDASSVAVLAVAAKLGLE